jgi:hypothetical protein
MGFLNKAFRKVNETNTAWLKCQSVAAALEI